MGAGDNYDERCFPRLLIEMDFENGWKVVVLWVSEFEYIKDYSKYDSQCDIHRDIPSPSLS